SPTAYSAISRPPASQGVTSSAANSPCGRAGVQRAVVIGKGPRVSERIDQRIRNQLAVEHALPAGELQALRRAADHVDVAADIEDRGRLARLGAEHRIAGLAFELVRVRRQHAGGGHDMALVVRIVKNRLTD